MTEKIRVHQLARELGLSSKEMINILRSEGVEVKSHANTIEDEVAELVREHILSERREKSTAPKAPPEEKAVKEPAGSDTEEALEEEADEDGSEKEVHLKPPIIVRDLAKALGCKPNEIIGELMTLNIFAAINQVVEPEAAAKICTNHGCTLVAERREKKKTKEAPAKGRRRTKATETPKAGKRSKRKGSRPRPPVIAVLGHVDHGKTSLLDWLRKSDVVSGEAGGITQHIGASTVEWQGHQLTFLDTPGHEAFTAMRARGANATDLVVLIVAADDGVMPQTVESLDHAKAADVPVVVAMNKIDLPGADQNKVLLGLQENDITPEDWGGDVGVVPVSAVTGQGIEDLLERIVLESEMLELACSPEAPAEGLVIESQIEKGRGPTANVLIRDGTLHTGDIILCSQYYGRTRALIDQSGQNVNEAGPSTAVKVMGLSGPPESGETFEVVESEDEAKGIAEQRREEAEQEQQQTTAGASLEDLFAQMEQGQKKELKLILKADVRGSVEAINDSLNNLQSEKIDVNILHEGVGSITENDILLAAASGAIIIGFHVRAPSAVQKKAKEQSVEIRLYSVIYELLEDIKDAMRGQLEPEIHQIPLGKAQILEIFNISGTGKICGCRVEEGEIRVGANARVLRDGDEIYNGTIVSLKHFQDDVKQMRNGQECGIKLDNFEDFEVGDIIRAFEIKKVKSEL
ncbi:MAG: translation initiation factor IF-2 [Lentisphaeria bacterium]